MSLYEFVKESNRIEGIHRDPTDVEVAALRYFIGLPVIAITDIESIVTVFQPGARLRDRHGLNVRVGNHFPPRGSPEIKVKLQALLDDVNAGIGTPHRNHVRYETLHPFTDGNGRSGRAVWLWQMRDAPLGFLHHFYYQTLQATNPDSLAPSGVERTREEGK